MSGTRAYPISLEESEMLVDIIKLYIDIINDKSTKFEAISKKAMAWQEIANKFVAMTGHNKTPQQVRKIWENMKNKAKKAEKAIITGEKKSSSKSLDPVSATVLPLIDDQMILPNPWDPDTQHDNVENTQESAVMFCMPEIKGDISDQEQSTSTLPVPMPVPTSEQMTALPSAPLPTSTYTDTQSTISPSNTPMPPYGRSRNSLKQKKSALRLAAERHSFQLEMDLELHKKRLELIDQEKFKIEQETLRINELYEAKKELVELQKRLLLEKHKTNNGFI